MSVEIDGPKGYEVQYLITVWLALLGELKDRGSAVVMVEGIEDAELRLSISGMPLSIAMQSKNQVEPLSLDEFAEWLLHFTERSGTDCLLGCVIKESERLALFVTKARCMDAVHPFAGPRGELKSHTEIPIKNAEVPKLADALKSAAAKGKTSLMIQRATTADKLATEILESSNQAALQRIVVWEQVTKEWLEGEVTALLTKFLIPQSQAHSVTLVLLENVRQARDSRGDLMPSFRDTLRRNASGRMLGDSFHLPRPEMAELADELEKKRVLWLTGRSQCGKSWMARALAQSLQDSGVHCKEIADINEARSFLTGDELTPRLALMDDPLSDAANPLKAWEKISEFASSLPKQHFLIVTTKRDELAAIDLQLLTKEVDSFGNQWRDVASTDRQFLNRLWEGLVAAHDVEKSVAEAIIEFLSSCDPPELLQPGQLSHLARSPAENLKDRDVNELVNLARVNSKTLSNEIAANADLRTISLLLGIAATSRGGIHTREVSYLESNAAKPISPAESEPFLEDGDDGTERFDAPGRRRRAMMRSVSFAPEASLSRPSFPKYRHDYTLSEKGRASLLNFEKRGFLEYKNDRYRFTHPDYREAFALRVFLECGSGVEDVCHLLLWACSTLDLDVGESAVRVAGRWIEKVGKGDAELSEKIAAILFSAMESSIFPTVQDEAFRVLVGVMDLLTQSKADSLLRTAAFRTRSERDFVWEGEIPWLSGSNEDWLMTDKRRAHFKDQSDFDETANRLRNPKTATSVSARDADALVTDYLGGARTFLTDYLEGSKTPELPILRALLNRPEAFIRADVAKIVFSSQCAVNAQLRQSLFEDEHPDVVVRAVYAAFHRWPTLDDATKADLKRLIPEAFNDTAVAAMSCKWLYDLGDKYSNYHGIRWADWSPENCAEIWKLWSDSMVQVLTTVKGRKVWMLSGDFFRTFRAASEFLLPEKALQLAAAWTEWIDAQTLLHPIDDYSISVVEFLTATVPKEHEGRRATIERMLKIPETDVRMNCIGDLVDSWEDLSDGEQNVVFTALADNAPDVDWLRARALTRRYPSPEIAKTVTGNADFFSLPASQQVDLLPPALVECCLVLFAGQTGFGSTFSVPSERDWWPFVEEHITRRNNPHFRLAISCFLGLAASMQTENVSLVGKWTAFCGSVDDADWQVLMDELLARSMNHTGAFLGPFWQTLITTCQSEDKRMQIVDKVVSNIEGLSVRNDHGTEIIEVFGTEFFDKDILQQCEGDKNALEILVLFPTPDADGLSSEPIATMIEAMYLVKPPRIHLVHSWVERWLEKAGTESSRRISEIVQKAKESCRATAEVQSEARRPYDSKVKNWCVRAWPEIA